MAWQIIDTFILGYIAFSKPIDAPAWVVSIMVIFFYTHVFSLFSRRLGQLFLSDKSFFYRWNSSAVLLIHSYFSSDFWFRIWVFAVVARLILTTARFFLFQRARRSSFPWMIKSEVNDGR